MPIHIVDKGECLSSIAAKYSLPWQTVYYHPDNQGFRTKRPNPNIIYKGDSLVIPEGDCFASDRPTDDLHKFVLKRQKTLLSLVVQDASGKPLEDKKYKLRITGRPKPYTGTVGSNGLVEVEIHAGATEGLLTVYAAGGGYQWPLAIGDLDPIELPSGTIGRLQNLAYEIADEAPPEDLSAALKAFQLDHKLPVTGKLDSSTRKKLIALHDDAKVDLVT
jgi:hypothetical protein